MSSDLTKTKEINYRGGILTFNIPLDWIEEYDENDGGTFYEDSPTSGTLRVKLLTMKSPRKITSDNVEDVLESINEDVIMLPNKNAYKHYSEETTDSGYKIYIFYWSLAQIIEPNNARLVNFSYTVLSDLKNSEFVKNEISFITNEVENANLSSELGSFE